MNRRSLNNRVIPLLLLVIMAASFACATNATAQRKAYTSISDVAATAKLAMQGFNVLYQSGKATEQDRETVLAAYAIYQRTALEAVDMAKDPAQKIDALRLASNAAEPLINLIAAIKARTP